jgi:hypothetical protein
MQKVIYSNEALLYLKKLQYIFYKSSKFMYFRCANKLYINMHGVTPNAESYYSNEALLYIKATVYFFL